MSDDEERPGGMRFQDGSTTPREPTLAERRAREQAQRRQEEAARQSAEGSERAKLRRRRILIGAGVTVGIVAVIAVGYAVAQPDEEVRAQCIDEETDEIVDDSNCVTPVANNGGYYGGGVYPIFIGGGGRQYHYNYGGSGTVGQRVSGGTMSVPSDGTRVRSSSGRDISPRASSSGSGSVSRGGLGVSGGGSSSGS